MDLQPKKPIETGEPVGEQASGKLAMPEKKTPPVSPVQSGGLVVKKEGCPYAAYSSDGITWKITGWNPFDDITCGRDNAGDYIRFIGRRLNIEIRGQRLVMVSDAYQCQTLFKVSPSTPATKVDTSRPFIKSVEICKVEESEAD